MLIQTKYWLKSAKDNEYVAIISHCADQYGNHGSVSVTSTTTGISVDDPTKKKTAEEALSEMLKLAYWFLDVSPEDVYLDKDYDYKVIF